MSSVRLVFATEIDLEDYDSIDEAVSEVYRQLKHCEGPVCGLYFQHAEECQDGQEMDE